MYVEKHFSMFLLAFACVTLTVNLAECTISFGGCPERESAKGLTRDNLPKLAGIWYLYGMDGPQFISDGCSCSLVDLICLSDSSRCKFTQYFALPSFGSSYSTTGTTCIRTTRGFQIINVNYDGPVLSDITSQVQVVATDYTNYAIVSYCSDFKYFQYQTVVILTRQRIITNSEILTKIRDALASFTGLNVRTINLINHNNCAS